MKLTINKKEVDIKKGDVLEVIGSDSLVVVGDVAEDVALVKSVKTGDIATVTKEELELLIIRIVKQSGIVMKFINWIASLFKKK